MKVTHFNRGYAISASEHEMAFMRAMAKHMIWTEKWEAYEETLSDPQRRALRRRMNGGKIFRKDIDRRSGDFIGEVYDGPHAD